MLTIMVAVSVLYGVVMGYFAIRCAAAHTQSRALPRPYDGLCAKLEQRPWYGLVVLCVAALLPRVVLACTVVGHPTDMGCFASWSWQLWNGGTDTFYFLPNYFADYPPGYMLVLYVIGGLRTLFGTTYLSAADLLLLKLPAILADLGIVWLLYSFSRKHIGNAAALCVGALYAFMPFTFVNSAIWGQIDAVFTLALVASLILLYQKRLYLSAYLFTLCVLIKPQGLMFTPVYIYAFIDYTRVHGVRGSWKQWLYAIAGSLCIIYIVALPFGGPLDLWWLVRKYKNTLSSYPYITVNAYNLYALLGLNWIDQSIEIFRGVSYSLIGYAAIGAAVVWGAVLYIRGVRAKDDGALFIAGYGILSVMFTVGTKMHERYLFPALLLLLCYYGASRRRNVLYLFIVQAAVHVGNVLHVLYRDVGTLSLPDFDPTVVVLSALQVCVFAYGAYVCWTLAREQRSMLPAVGLRRVARQLPQPAHSDDTLGVRDFQYICAILLLYGIVSFINLGSTVAPQTYATTPPGGVGFDFGRPVEIKRVMVYFGPSQSFGEWSIGGYDDVRHTFTHGSVLQWTSYGVDIAAEYVTFTHTSPDDPVFEIGFFDAADNRVFPQNVTLLSDEPDTVPQYPDYLNSGYFDEIYHPRTAFEILEELPPYEITHPPLGKVIMSLGMLLFGYNPLGWRFMGNLAGIAMLGVLYVLAFWLTKRRSVAVVATLLLALDFMHFAQTRMGTIDSFAVLFILCSYTFMWRYIGVEFDEHVHDGRRWLLLSGLFYGLSCATKWIGLYSTLGLVIMLLYAWIRGFLRTSDPHVYWRALGRTVGYCCVFFIAIPIAIYVASYLPMTRYDLHGRGFWEYVWGNQTYMLSYHGSVFDEHPYASPWYTWALNIKPLWAYIDSRLYSTGMASTISSFGNPAVWWLGLLAVLSCIPLMFRGSKAAVFIVTAYASQYLLWAFVPRTLFIYHYFGAVPFLCIALAYMLQYLADAVPCRVTRYAPYAVVIGCAVLFVLFYPVISGHPVSLEYVRTYLKWLPDWVFIY